MTCGSHMYFSLKCAPLILFPTVNSDSNGYIATANAYLKAGFKEKAVKMLKKSEQFM